MPDFDTRIWFGLMAPTGTPREVIDKLARTLNAAQHQVGGGAARQLQEHRVMSTLGGSRTISRATMQTASCANGPWPSQAAGVKK